MKKILILANNDVGLYNFRKELIEKLIKENYELYISLPDGEKISLLKDLGCNFVETNVDRRGMNPLNDIKLLLNYFKIIKKIKPDIVLTYTIKPNIYGGIACRLKKVPYLVNITGLGTAIESKGILSKILLKLYKFALKRAKCVFFQNEANKDLFIKCKIVKDNYKLIPGSGVNLIENSFTEYPKNDVIKFLFIGRVMKTKGIEEFLETAKIIKEKYKNTEFIILGGYDQEIYREKINEYVNKDIVKYEGFQKDVRKYILESNCIILPSYNEGMANVLLEAASTGRPIIASNINGCKEAINEGINGYLVEAKSVNSLVEKIEKFINLSYDEQREMGTKGREKVEKEFDRNIVIKAYMEEINV